MENKNQTIEAKTNSFVIFVVIVTCLILYGGALSTFITQEVFLTRFDNPVTTRLVGLFFIAFFSWLAFSVSAIQFRIVLDNNQLTTYSLRGKQQIDLSRVCSIKNLLIKNRYTRAIRGIKLVDDSGKSLPLILGLLKEDIKTPLKDSLASLFANPNIIIDQVSRDIFDSWYSY